MIFSHKYQRRQWSDKNFKIQNRLRVDSKMCGLASLRGKKLYSHSDGNNTKGMVILFKDDRRFPQQF